MLQVGERLPAVRLQRAPGDEATLEELVDGRSTLFLFYLFDWSST